MKTLSRGFPRPYYCIVSTGKVTLPGGKSLSMDSADAVLRKLNLNPETGTRTATRTIETWLKPVYTTQSPLKTDKAINLNNHNIFIDSFNTNPPTHEGDPIRYVSVSTVINGVPVTYKVPGTMGQFDAPNFPVLAANIATNSKFAAIGNATVYGDVLTNGGATYSTDGSGPTVTNTSNVKGEIINNYYEPIEPIYAPQWPSLSYTWGMTVSVGKQGSKTGVMNVTSSPVAPITGGTKSVPTRIKVDSIKLSGANDQIIFAPGTVDPVMAIVTLSCT